MSGKNFGSIVREARLSKGMTQHVLSKAIQTTERTIARIENGGKPSPETAMALQSVLDIKSSDILAILNEKKQETLVILPEINEEIDEKRKELKDIIINIMPKAKLVTAFDDQNGEIETLYEDITSDDKKKSLYGKLFLLSLIAIFTFLITLFTVYTFIYDKYGKEIYDIYVLVGMIMTLAAVATSVLKYDSFDTKFKMGIKKLKRFSRILVATDDDIYSYDGNNLSLIISKNYIKSIDDDDGMVKISTFENKTINLGSIYFDERIKYFFQKFI